MDTLQQNGMQKIIGWMKLSIRSSIGDVNDVYMRILEVFFYCKLFLENQKLLLIGLDEGSNHWKESAVSLEKFHVDNTR